MCLFALAAGGMAAGLAGAGAAGAAAGGAAAAAASISASTALMAGGLGISAIGTGMQISGQIKQAKYQRAMAKRNAEMSRWRAQDALKRGRAAESRHRMAVLRLGGAQIAALSASGVVLGEGTAASLLEDTYWMGELDAAIIRENAQREAWGYEMQAGADMAQADMYRSAGRYGATQSLLSAATTALDKYERWKKA